MSFEETAVTSPPGEPLVLDLESITPRRLDEAARFYAENGFLFLCGVEQAITRPLREVVADTLDADAAEMRELLSPHGPRWNFPTEVRRRLCRVETPPGLAVELIDALRPIVGRLLGPMVHVSSTFHAQFKAADALEHAVDHGGYQANCNHMELHGAYLLHQDFTGASIPTSPSAITLWTGLNDCSDWTLRIYPGSHRLGLVCHRWLANDDPRLQRLRPPLEIRAEPGCAALFHAMLIHGGGRSGTRRRVSCDIRMFPLCGFLPTQPHFLEPRPLEALDRQTAQRSGPTRTASAAGEGSGPSAALATSGTVSRGDRGHEPSSDDVADGADDVLRVPRDEARLFLGQRPLQTDRLPNDGPSHGAGPLPMDRWVAVVQAMLADDARAAYEHLGRWVNSEIGTGTVDDYARFLRHRPQREMLATLYGRLAEAEPDAEALEGLSALIARLSATSQGAGVANARN